MIHYQTWLSTANSCFGSFGYAVSEEKIFLDIEQSDTRIACGGHVC
jgi:hypothetical protein